MHTPEQAKSLWCPMARIARHEVTEETTSIGSGYTKSELKHHVVAGCNRDALGRMGAEIKSCRCIADSCAMWRWVPKHKLVTFDQAYGTPPVLVGNVQLSRVRTDSTHGYCGLAPVHGVAA